LERSPKGEATDSIAVAVAVVFFRRFSPKNCMSSPKTTQLSETEGNRVGMIPLSNPLYFK
jgi:hypothetical protein